MLALGQAEHHAGLPNWQETLVLAGEMARALGDTNLAARCILGGALGWSVAPGQPDRRRLELMTFALEEGQDLDDDLRVRLMGAYADELAFTADLAERIRLSDQAMALARSSGRPTLLLNALNHRFNAIWAPETLESRRHDATLACRLAEAGGNQQPRAISAGFAMAAALEAADLDETDHQLKVFTSLAEDARRFGIEHGRPEAEMIHLMQRAAIRWLQGRLGEEVTNVARLVDAFPTVPALRALSALALLRSGRRHDAERLLMEASTSGSIEALPHDQAYLAAVMQWAEIAAATREVGVAGDLYELLVPYSQRFCFTGAAVYGPVSHALGVLAWTAGDIAAAKMHLRGAEQMATNMPSPPFAARARKALNQISAWPSPPS
jgi:hypothetical protein